MTIRKLSLTGFRNYAKKQFKFSDNVTVLSGKNAVGKTNVLEAIYLLASGGSFQAQKIEEMVAWGKEVSHVEGEVIFQNALSEGEKNILQVILTRGEVQGKRVRKRRYLVNGIGRRRVDFMGRFFAVIFRPQDLRLIEGSPSRRRRFLDEVLSQVDTEYRRSLVNYDKGLRRRNKVLMAVREGQTSRTALSFWNQLLVREGEVLFHKRWELIEYINSVDVLLKKRSLVYKHSVVTVKRQLSYMNREIAAGHTLIGPHKDDFVIMDHAGMAGGERNISIFGSRGEQRMSVLWLKLCELAFVTHAVGEKPVLLLDDIFSELDDEHDVVVMEMLDDQQTILTTTDELNLKDKKNWLLMEL